MNKLWLVLIFTLLCYSYSYSQTISDSSHSKVIGIIKIYPTEIPFGEFRMAYEMPVTHHLSWESGAGFIYRVEYGELNGVSSYLERGDFLFGYRGLSLRSGIKLYIGNKNANAGFYLNPLIFVKNNYQKDNDASNPPYTDIFYTIGFQSLFGYRFPAKNKFSFEIYAGWAIRKAIENYTNYAIYYSGTETYLFATPQLGFTVGYKLMKK